MAAPVQNDRLIERIIGFAIEVHRHLGPALLESAYEECLCYEQTQSALVFRRQVPLPVLYKGVRLECGYRLDIDVENQVILAIKSVEHLLPIHDAQVLTYMKLSAIPTALLLNFTTPALTDALRRLML